ncbi:hypothetical protein [Burkholderia multivorans]|uniref:hypothetical protein n=1 Tax=Burkholderia multivorans TaxID=87883 RepID=UPI0012DA6E07|nr:hypothetical protein [Burkholderia multivorans]
MTMVILGWGPVNCKQRNGACVMRIDERPTGGHVATTAKRLLIDMSRIFRASCVARVGGRSVLTKRVGVPDGQASGRSDSDSGARPGPRCGTTRIGSNREDIGDALLKLKVTDPNRLTGPDLDRLARLQSRHDYHGSLVKDRDEDEVRELANRDVLRWATHELATLI